VEREREVDKYKDRKGDTLKERKGFQVYKAKQQQTLLQIIFLLRRINGLVCKKIFPHQKTAAINHDQFTIQLLSTTHPVNNESCPDIGYSFVINSL